MLILLFFSLTHSVDILSCTKSLKILLTNDDGVAAEGLQTLTKTLEREHDVAVMAPLKNFSAQGHTLSLKEKLIVLPFGDNVYGCTGSPADCVRLGVHHIYTQNNMAPPDLVISGINHDPNFGHDIYYSGTVGAAREANIQGLPAMAVSLALKNTSDKVHHFETAAEVVRLLVSKDIYQTIEKTDILNINVPDIPLEQLQGLEVTGLGRIHYPDEIRGKYRSQGRSLYQYHGKGHICLAPHESNTDCNAVEQRKVSLTLIELLPSLPKEKKDLLMKTISD